MNLRFRVEVDSTMMTSSEVYFRAELSIVEI